MSGDWRELLNNMQRSCFDIILTAETIYRASHYEMLVSVFKHALKPSGKVYLNAKSNYYGVGGNINDFINYVKEDGTFNFQTIQTSGSGVLRYVVVMWFK